MCLYLHCICTIYLAYSLFLLYAFQWLVYTCLFSECQIEHCAACFSNSFCTQCRRPFIAYRGRCTDSCPEGLHYANYSKDCRLLGNILYSIVNCWVVVSFEQLLFTLRVSNHDCNCMALSLHFVKNAVLL